MSPSLQTMGFFMSDINFCNTKEQLNHLGEVVTGKVDGSPSGADIETSTLSYTGQVRKTLPALEAEYEQSISNKESEADAAIDEYRLLNKGPYAAGITLESKFEYIIYNGESYFATNPPYTTTAIAPDADGNLFVGGYISEASLSSYTDLIYKASGGNSAVENMLANFDASPLSYAIGTVTKTGGTTWEYIDSTGPITESNFRVLGSIFANDFGAYGNAGDDTTAIIRAISAAKSLRDSEQLNYVEVDLGGMTSKVSSSIDVPFGVLLRNGVLIPTGDFDVINSDKKGLCRNIKVLVIDDFTSSAFIMKPTVSGIQGHQNDFALWDDCSAVFPSNQYTGTAFSLDAEFQYIQYVQVGKLTASNALNALKMYSPTDPTTWCNGNLVDGVIAFDCTNALLLDGAGGNKLDNIMAENNGASTAITLINESNANNLTGLRWDAAYINIDSSCAFNRVNADATGAFPSISDNGKYNSCNYSGGEYENHTSITRQDTRNSTGNRTGGLIKFEDKLIGGMRDEWIVTESGTALKSEPSQYWFGNDEGGVIRTHDFTVDTPDLAMRSCILDPVCSAGALPKCDITFIGGYRMGTHSRMITGLGNRTDGILIEIDPTFNANGNIFINRYEAGSLIDSEDTGVGSSGGVAFLVRIEILPDLTSEISIGRYISSAGNDDGKYDRGTDCMYRDSASTYVGIYKTTAISNDKTLFGGIYEVEKFAVGTGNLANNQLAHFAITSADV